MQFQMKEKRMSEETKNDFRQEETANIQKSANPDTEYMKDRNLCTVCHGVVRLCDRTDCPNLK